VLGEILAHTGNDELNAWTRRMNGAGSELARARQWATRSRMQVGPTSWSLHSGAWVLEGEHERSIARFRSFDATVCEDFDAADAGHHDRAARSAGGPGPGDEGGSRSSSSPRQNTCRRAACRR
jgi:hypothetical protein